MTRASRCCAASSASTRSRKPRTAASGCSRMERRCMADSASTATTASRSTVARSRCFTITTTRPSPRPSTRSRVGGPIRYAVIGLGSGSLACRAEPADTVHYYEIDPASIRIARDPKLFTFLVGMRLEFADHARRRAAHAGGRRPAPTTSSSSMPSPPTRSPSICSRAKRWQSIATRSASTAWW